MSPLKEKERVSFLYLYLFSMHEAERSRLRGQIRRYKTFLDDLGPEQG